MRKQYTPPTLETIAAKAAATLGHRLNISEPSPLDPDLLSVTMFDSPYLIEVTRHDDGCMADLTVYEIYRAGHLGPVALTQIGPMPLAELEPAIWKAVLDCFGSPDDCPSYDETDDLP